MQSAMEEVNRLHAARGLPRLEMGIGLNTGEAVVGNIGSEKRAKYAVVGSAVNLAARVEGCTVGGQILLSPHTYERLCEIAEVGPPLPVQLKGIRDPVVLYELRGLTGDYAARLPEAPADAGPGVQAALPLRCWVIDGKTVLPDTMAGQVVRLRPGQLEVQLDSQLPPLTNLRLRLQYPDLGQESGDVYGKVVAAHDRGSEGIIRIGLTSVDSTDQQILETMLREGEPRPPSPDHSRGNP
jgi:adenylate cyclase